MAIKNTLKYVNVPVVDVEGILPFNKGEIDDLSDEISEEKRVKDEISKFVKILQKNMHNKIFYIGEEKRYGKHLERFMFEHDGFLEIMVEEPLTINAHFTRPSRAHRYAKALRKTFHKMLPESGVKDMFIESVSVDEKDTEPLTFEKWDKMHNVILHKGLIFTIVALFIVIIFEAIKALLTEISVEFFHVSSLAITMISAIIISLFFDPIRKRADRVVSRFMIK